MKKTLAKILYLLVAIMAIGTVGAFLFKAKIFASDTGGGDQQIINLGSGLESKTVRTAVSNNKGSIEVDKSMFSNCSSALSGFQDEAKIRGTISVGGDKKLIEVVGVAGAHTENRQYFSVDNNYCPKPIAFVKNGTINYNIYSDEPSFLLQDFNADNVTDLAVEYRNYDLSPILDGARDIYIFDSIGNKFDFSRTESFQYQEID
ncbi:MAG: hypothetical protein WCG99_02480 [Candidatus Berkelbacteria bacterium]